MVGNQPLCGGDKVIKYILLLQLHPRLVPRFAVFAAAPQIGRSIDKPLLQQGQAQRIKFGRNGDVEAAISVEQRGIVSIELQSALENQKHRHPGAVFAGVEHLHASRSLRAWKPLIADSRKRVDSPAAMS